MLTVLRPLDAADVSFLFVSQLHPIRTPKRHQNVIQFLLVAPLHQHICLVHDEGSSLYEREQGGGAQRPGCGGQ